MMKTSIKMISRGLAIIALSLICLCLCAQENNAVEIAGFTEIDHISYFKNEAFKVNGRNQGILQLEISGKNENITYFGAIEFRNDLSDLERDRIWTDELYVTYKSNSYDFTIGKKIYAWGVTDWFSPTNILNPIDYSDLLDTEDETIGVYSANLKYYWGNHYLESMIIPVFRPSVIPNMNSRWQPFQPTEASIGDSIVPIKYLSISETPVEKDIRSIQYALRFGGSLKGIDYDINYFNGFDDIPYYHQFSALSNDSLEVTFNINYHQIQMIGINLSTVIAGMVFKTEWAYNHQKRPENQHIFMGAPFHYMVTGIDKNISNFLGDTDLLFTIQYIYQSIQTDFEVNSFNFNHIFQNSWMINFDLTFSNKLKLTAAGVYDFNADHYFIMPEMILSPDDGLNLSLKTYFTGGDANSLFGSFNNNRLQLIAKYNF